MIWNNNNNYNIPTDLYLDYNNFDLTNIRGYVTIFMYVDGEHPLSLLAFIANE